MNTKLAQNEEFTIEQADGKTLHMPTIKSGTDETLVSTEEIKQIQEIVSRHFKVNTWNEPQTDDSDKVSSKSTIHFKTGAFGAQKECVIKDITLHTHPTITPPGLMYASIVSAESPTLAIATSERVDVSQTNTDYTFTFTDPLNSSPLQTNTPYQLVFHTDKADVASRVNLAIVVSHAYAEDQDIYYDTVPKRRPICFIRFFYPDEDQFASKSYVDEKTTVGIGGMWKALSPTTYNVDEVDYPIEVQITSQGGANQITPTANGQGIGLPKVISGGETIFVWQPGTDWPGDQELVIKDLTGYYLEGQEHLMFQPAGFYLTPEDLPPEQKIPEIELLECLEWQTLKTKAENGELEPGKQYRITDYVTTTAQDKTISQKMAFDLIVTADSSTTVNCVARAIQHESPRSANARPVASDYFQDCKLSMWKVWYCLENDTNRFAWADENGKGVIFRLIDEFGNDAPYDFKNIQFLPLESSAWDVVKVAGSEDLTGEGAADTYYVTDDGQTFTWDGSNYTQAESPFKFAFGYSDGVEDSKYGKSYNNRIGAHFEENGSDRKYAINYVCMSGNGNSVGSGCSYISLPDNSRNVTIHNGVKDLVIQCTATRDNGEWYQNVVVLPGTTGMVSDSECNQAFSTTFQPAGSNVVSVV